MKSLTKTVRDGWGRLIGTPVSHCHLTRTMRPDIEIAFKKLDSKQRRLEEAMQQLEVARQTQADLLHKLTQLRTPHSS